MSEWRPIESAPKDGSVVLLSYPPSPAYIGQIGIAGLIVPCKWDGEDWRDGITGESTYRYMTHWMPLPEPPK